MTMKTKAIIQPLAILKLQAALQFQKAFRLSLAGGNLKSRNKVESIKILNRHGSNQNPKSKSYYIYRHKP
jgi:hypothetical protein